MFDIVAEAKEYLCWFLSSSTDKPSDVSSKYNLKSWDYLKCLRDTQLQVSNAHDTLGDFFLRYQLAYTLVSGVNKIFFPVYTLNTHCFPIWCVHLQHLLIDYLMFKAWLHAFYIQSNLYDPSLIQTQGPPVLAARVCGLRMCAIVPGLCGYVFSLCGVCAYACVYTQTHTIFHEQRLP